MLGPQAFFKFINSWIYKIGIFFCPSNHQTLCTILPGNQPTQTLRGFTELLRLEKTIKIIQNPNHPKINHTKPSNVWLITTLSARAGQSVPHSTHCLPWNAQLWNPNSQGWAAAGSDREILPVMKKLLFYWARLRAGVTQRQEHGFLSAAHAQLLIRSEETWSRSITCCSPVTNS